MDPNAGTGSARVCPRTSAAGARCTVCRGDLALHLSGVQDSFSGETFAIWRCGGCGLGHTTPRVGDSSSYYGQSYWGERHAFTAEYCSRRRMRLLDAVAPGARRRLLDYGCGDGNFLARAHRRGWNATGFEATFSPVRPSSEYEVVRTHDELAKHGPFDAITLWHVLEHLPEPLRTLNALVDLLAPEGVLLLAVPDAGSVQASVFGRRWMHLDVPRHLHHYNRSALEGLLARASLEPRRWWAHEFEYDLMGWAQSALACVGSPSAFFEAITGRIPFGGRWARAVASGVAVSVVAWPLAVKWGSSLTVAARRRGAT